jgi:SAM-dependent methyltransferase
VPIVERAWNHNTHYHRRLLRHVPDGSGRALDVGCGDGTFARRLAAKSSAVIALDSDRAQAEYAREECADLANVSVVHGDFLTANLEHASFDLVTSLASLHHFPFEAAIARSCELLRPGGRLIALGLWTDNTAATDRALNHVAGAMNKFYRRIWGPDVMNAPTTTPEMTLRDVRRDAAGLVPEAAVRRCLLWRYVLVWRKPTTA